MVRDSTKAELFMSEKKPTFSVVLPTYNRAQYLPLAIRSVLNQTCSDFELIISNGGSTDNTKDVVESFDDPRIRYIESKEKLSIGGNYQTALNEANGKYITFLGDDDAFVPTMFEQVGQIINQKQAEIVAFRFCNYYSDNYVEFNGLPIQSNSMAIESFGSKLTALSAGEALNLLFAHHKIKNAALNKDFIIPYLANAVYHHTVFSKLKTKTDCLFALTPADMYLAAAVFYVIETYYCLDKPLLVWNRWSGSSTASPRKKGIGLRRHYENLLNGNSLENTPLKFPLPLNCGINAILQAKNDFCDKTEVDWKLYYKSIHIDLLSLREIGIDVSKELEEFERILTACPTDFQRAIRAEISGGGNLIKETLKNKMPMVINFLKRLRDPELPNNSSVIKGADVDFNNVLEAAQYLNKRVS
jgi:glycosyltransferase involved in cell wall biosynthesis